MATIQTQLASHGMTATRRVDGTGTAAAQNFESAQARSNNDSTREGNNEVRTPHCGEIKTSNHSLQVLDSKLGYKIRM